MSNLVELSGVEVAPGGRPVLSGLDLVIAPGEVLGVSGPNGSGKTTLLRLVATLLPPSGGTGTVLGAALGTDQVRPLRRQIGLISHVPAVLPELSLEENLHHIARIGGLPRDRVPWALGVVGLEQVGGTRAGHASFGMIRRTETARLLLTRPRLLLLDEAYSGLDVAAQELIGALTRRTLDDGGAVLIVSHDPEQVGRHATRRLTIRQGRLEDQQ